jgi:hypothetical protein
MLAGTSESTSMNRTLGVICASFLILGATTAGRAQTDAFGRYENGSHDYGIYPYGDEPYGGFGMDYVQAPSSGGLVMDRFGMIHEAPVVGSRPVVAAERVSVRSETRSRSARTRPRRAQAQAQARGNYQLPTGALRWKGGEGVLLYSPALRYQSYGGGAARSPYGSIDYGSMWMGWPLSW